MNMIASNIKSGRTICTPEYVELDIGSIRHYIDFYNEDHEILMSVGHTVPNDLTSFKLPKGTPYRLEGSIQGPIFIKGTVPAGSDLFYVGG